MSAAIVAAIDAAILSMMANGGAQRLTINGREVWFPDLDKLLAAQKFYSDQASNTADKTPFGVYNTKPKGVN